MKHINDTNASHPQLLCHTRNTLKKCLATTLASLIVMFMICDCCLSNSAEPPAIVLYIDKPELVADVKFFYNGIEAAYDHGPDIVRAGYKVCYYVYDWIENNSAEGKISIKVMLNDGSSFSVGIPSESYGFGKDAITLDVENRTIIQGTATPRTIIMTVIRLVFTLVIEGIIFALFAYREKKSWICFLLLNTVTQIALSFWLIFPFRPAARNYPFPAADSSFALVFMEILITISEIIVLRIIISEHGKRRQIAFAIVANALSFILGGLAIAYLPI